MPELNIERTKRKVKDPLQKVFDPGPANTAVEDALVGFGRDVTKVAGAIAKSEERKKKKQDKFAKAAEAIRDRQEQIRVNEARIDYANELAQAQKDIFSDKTLDPNEALDQYVLKSQEILNTMSSRHLLTDKGRLALGSATSGRVTSGIDSLARAIRERANTDVVKTIADSQAMANKEILTNPTPEKAKELIDEISAMIDGHAANPLTNAGVFGKAGASASEVKEGIANGINESMVQGRIQQDAEGTLASIESGDLDDMFKDADTKQEYINEAERQVADNKRKQKIAKQEAQKVEGERIFKLFDDGDLTFIDIRKANLPATEGSNSKLAWRARLKGAATNSGQKYTKSDPDIYAQVYVALTTEGLVTPITDDELIAFIGDGLSVKDVDHFRAVLAESNKPESIATTKADTIALGTIKKAFEAGEFGPVNSRKALFEYTRQVGDFERWRATHPNDDSAAYMADTFKKSDTTLMDKAFGGKSDPILVRTERRAGITFDALLEVAREQNPDIDAEELRELFIEEFQ